MTAERAVHELQLDLRSQVEKYNQLQESRRYNLRCISRSIKRMAASTSAYCALSLVIKIVSSIYCIALYTVYKYTLQNTTIQLSACQLHVAFELVCNSDTVVNLSSDSLRKFDGKSLSNLMSAYNPVVLMNVMWIQAPESIFRGWHQLHD